MLFLGGANFLPSGADVEVSLNSIDMEEPRTLDVWDVVHWADALTEQSFFVSCKAFLLFFRLFSLLLEQGSVDDSSLVLGSS